MSKEKIKKVKDLIGKPFIRDDDYTMRIFDRALVEDVKKDVIVEFGDYYELYGRYGRYSGIGQPLPGCITIPDTPNKSKVKAYCKIVNSYLQFPRALRVVGTRCVADITSTTGDKIGGFYRFVPGTVRREGSNIVVA